MGAPITVFNEKAITLTGHFNVKETYTDLLDYLEETFQYDHSVLDYDEKNQGGKREVNAKVETTRIISDEYKITLKFTIKFSGKDTTFENDGKKTQTQKGKANIIINAYINKSEEDKTGLAKLLDILRTRFVAHEDDGEIEDIAAEDVGAMFERLKSHFN